MKSFNPQHIEQLNAKKPKTSDSSWGDWLNKDIRLSKKLSPKYLEEIYNQLTVLLKSGLDIHAGIQLILETSDKKKKYLIEVLDRVSGFMLEGKTLSDSFLETQAFHPFDYYSIKIGEESGRLSEVFEDLKKYYQSKIALKRLVISSLTYPAIVILFTSLVVMFLMVFLVPMFQDMFSRTGSELPMITQVVISISDFLAQNFLYLFSALILSVILIWRALRIPKIKSYWDHILLRLPIIGLLVRKTNLLRFIQLLLLMAKAHVPITKSLELIKKSSHFYPLKNTCQQLSQQLIKGQSLSEALTEDHFISKKIKTLIKVGEQGNKLEEVYESLILELEKEISHQNKLITSLLEPFIILFLGVVVALVLISMYLPLFNINAGMHL
ncbi:MAG: type II secretion system F family protein [Flavobacteriales bacterium]|jgi:type IV pilus assembly protein PilC|nr:type II secretion system F family protein [Flavobacteriales bacterium]